MSEVENIAQNLLPLPQDSNKYKYLVHRISGLSMREACELVGCTDKHVHNWRRDEEFRKLDGLGMTELRQQLSDQYTNIEFTRNFHLVLQKDFDVLLKSVNGELTKEEEKYLLKLRAYYTPQHLLAMKQLVGEVAKDDGFDFTKEVFAMRLTRESIEVHTERVDGN